MFGAITNLRCTYWLHAILRNLNPLVDKHCTWTSPDLVDTLDRRV